MMLKMTVAVEARKTARDVRGRAGAWDPSPRPVLMFVGSLNGRRLVQRRPVSGQRSRFIAVDGQMRTNVAHIFAIGTSSAPMPAQGDARGLPRSGGRRKAYFDARHSLGRLHDPEIAWVGVTEDEEGGTGGGTLPWAASGRAIANGRDEGFTKLLFDDTTHRIVGGGIVGTHAGT